MTKQLPATQPQTNAHPVEVEAELAQLLLVQRLDSVQRVLRQRRRPLQRRQALVRLSRSRNTVSVHAMRMELGKGTDGQALVGLACQGIGGMGGLWPTSRSPHNQAHRFCRHNFKNCEWSLSSSAPLFYHVIVDFYHLQELGVAAPPTRIWITNVFHEESPTCRSWVLSARSSSAAAASCGSSAIFSTSTRVLRRFPCTMLSSCILSWCSIRAAHSSHSSSIVCTRG